MKTILGAILFFGLTAGLNCSAQLQIPLGSTTPSSNTSRAAHNTTRTLTGTVTIKGENEKPIPEAVVYLKNVKSLAMKTYISQTDGAYRFPGLSPNVDYEVYAQKNGKKSSTKTLSQFDDREKPNINLQIEMNK